MFLIVKRVFLSEISKSHITRWLCFERKYLRLVRGDLWEMLTEFRDVVYLLKGVEEGRLRDDSEMIPQQKGITFFRFY